MSKRASKPSPRSFPWRGSVIGLGCTLALMVVVFLVWGLANHRLSLQSWSAPPSYRGDSLFVLACIKAAANLELLPFMDRTIQQLGAPYAANWNDFPMFETIPINLMGMVARVSNLITAWHAGMLLSYLTSALGFYGACRLLRFRREWAAAGALLWAFSFYHNVRCEGHLPICFDYTVPLAVVCCWLITASQRFRLGGVVFWLSMVLGGVIGLGNPYNTHMWLQFVCLGIGLRFLRLRRKADLLAGALVVGATLLGFLAINLNHFAYDFHHGANQFGLARSYNQLELGALKPIELLLPPPQHRWVALTDLSRQYATSAAVKGELFSPYLGVVGIVALIWLFGESGLRLLKLTPGPRRLSLHAFLCVWVILYAGIGGLNGLIGLLGMILFRSSNRFSLFITAVCLLFLVSRMSRIARRWSRLGSCALAAGVAVLGLLDQIPIQVPGTAEAALKKLESDRAFCRVLEARLPAGAMVFEWPPMDFPESDPVGACEPYDHLRPYLWTKTLRFSFGSVKGRTREAWQAEVFYAPPEQLVKKLEGYGFAGLYFNRKAFEDGAEGKLKDLAKCGLQQLIEDEGREQVCLLLKPSPHPVLPHSDDGAQIAYKSGWVLEDRTEHGVRHWAAGDASLYFMNDLPQECTYHLTGALEISTPRRVDVKFDGQTLLSQRFERPMGIMVESRLKARPGRNYLFFSTDCPPEPPPEGAQVLRSAYAVVNLKIVRDPPSPP